MSRQDFNGNSRKRSLARLGVLAAALALAATGAHAWPAVYTLSGTGFDGSFNGTPFTDESFTITMYANTSEIVDIAGNEHIDPFDLVTITLNGIGTYTLSDPMALYGGTSSTEIAFDQYEPSFRNIFLWGLDSTVDLEHSFGPVGSQPFLESIGDVIPTSGGDLQFDLLVGTGPTLTLEGTVTTPEPAAWALMLTGFAGLGAALRGRRRLRVA
jgi:hypothetical protein